MLAAFDFETELFVPGRMAPPIVCSSTAVYADDKIESRLIVGAAESLVVLRQLLESDRTIAFANAAYDLAVAAQADESLFPLIFKAFDEGRIYDILIAESLNAIYYGHLGEMPDGSDLRIPGSKKPSRRYSLEIVTYLMTGRVDAKADDVFRKSYALLMGVPEEKWPARAKAYPRADAANTLESAMRQMAGCPGPHVWEMLPAIPEVEARTLQCTVCQALRKSDVSEKPWPMEGLCRKAALVPHKNASNHSAQVEPAFALHLGSAHSFRTDAERIEKVAGEAGEKYEIAKKRFQGKGWIRADGTEDQAAVKRAIAEAYGATGKCKRCGGSGRYTPTVFVECRGEKVKGRFRGCLGVDCKICFGATKVDMPGNETTCKNAYAEDDKLLEAGCDGTGLKLSTAALLPRTKNKEHPKRLGGVSTDRDSCMESGDDDIAEYGDDAFKKSLSTYVPYLRTGIDRPLSYSSNILVASGRCSYEGTPLHQMPRHGGERECVRARGAWCGSLVEYVLTSTDYEAGELVTLAQYCYWVLGYSKMREAINRSGKPGILHSDLAAEILGIPLDEFLVRLKNKDKQAIEFRQASKPMNFGKPGLMGPPKIVLTNRKSSAGFTETEYGPATNSKGKRGYHGIRFCILVGGQKTCGTEKITLWKNKVPCAPVCKKCCEVVDSVLGAAYNRRYPEIQDYFEWVFKTLDQYGNKVPCLVWDREKGKFKASRWRGFLKGDKAAACNNGFQAMLSDVGKLAFSRMTREGYTGRRPDGSPSPLGGTRFPLFAHDEPVGETPLHMLHLSAPRIAEIAEEAGRELVPDVTWRAETAAAFWWNKSMEPEYVVEDGQKILVPWGPIPEYLQNRIRRAA